MPRTSGAGRVLTLKGLAEAERALKKLPERVAKKVVRQAVRKALKPVRAAVAAAAPVGETGLLKRSAKVRAAKRPRRGSIGAQVRIGEGDFKGKTFYAAMVEFGHKVGKRGEPDRPEVPGRHYMEKAFESTKEAAAGDCKREVIAGVEREAAALKAGG